MLKAESTVAARASCQAATRSWQQSNDAIDATVAVHNVADVQHRCGDDINGYDDLGSGISPMKCTVTAGISPNEKTTASFKQCPAVSETAVDDRWRTCISDGRTD